MNKRCLWPLAGVLTLIASALPGAGCIGPDPGEPALTEAEVRVMAAQLEPIAEHVYQHNQTDLEFIRVRTVEAFGDKFLEARSWEEVSQGFVPKWNAGRAPWIEELVRLIAAFREHSALTRAVGVLQSYMANSEIVIYTGHARYGTGPDFDVKADQLASDVDTAGRVLQDELALVHVDGDPDRPIIVSTALSGAVSLSEDVSRLAIELETELHDEGAPVTELELLEGLFESHPFADDGYNPLVYQDSLTSFPNPIYTGFVFADDPFAGSNIESLAVVAERMVAVADGLAAGQLVEGMASMNMQFLALQHAVQMESRRFQTLSNASKARHDIAMNAIRNMK